MSAKKMYRQAGMTLIELMIAIVLGLLLIGAATAMTAKSMVMNLDTLTSARLNQDLDSVIQVMVNDIRRAGYAANITAGGADVVFADNEDLNIVSASCVLYAYNLDGDDVLDPEEKFGFKWDGGADDPIEMRTTCTTGACATSCDAGNWEPLTDPRVITITDLSFDSFSSKCISITDKDNVVNLSNKNNYWITTTAGTTDFPCMATSGTNLTTYVMDANEDYVSGTFVAPASGDRVIGTRQVNVQITAELANDDSMRKTQQVAINVRNNHIRTISSP